MPKFKVRVCEKQERHCDFVILAPSKASAKAEALRLVSSGMANWSYEDHDVQSAKVVPE
jgi:hypothetical protein